MPSAPASKVALATLILATAAPAMAHIAIWHPSVYGFNASGTEPEQYFNEPVNTNYLKNPLRLMDNLKFDDWWFHGLKGATPNTAMELPAGGRIMIEHSCNKAWTSFGKAQAQRDFMGNMPCDFNVYDGKPHFGNPERESTNGPVHTADITDAKGCGLAIAYTDDVNTLKPTDFTVFSVNHTCVWYKETYFDVPDDMPPCPDGKKCICSWNWIHGNKRKQGYGNELYMNGFDCTVTNSKSNRPLAKNKAPVDCRDDESTCIKGAKQALYWQGAVAEGWNVPDPAVANNPMIAPSYNSEWGFEDGAQQDIFETETATTSSSSSFTSSSDSSNIAPIQAVQNRVVVVDEETSKTKTLPVGDVNRADVFTSVVLATRYHYATVTAEAQNIKLSERDQEVLLERRAAPAHHVQLRGLGRARMAHVRRASPHRV